MISSKEGLYKIKKKMPIPTPNSNESKKEFLDRCMIDPTMVGEYDEKQRYAICESQLERNIKIVSGSPCSGKNTYVAENKRKGDIVWDFDKIHTALTGEESHNHIEAVRKYIFSMRKQFYNDLKNEKDLRVWIINSSPIKQVRQELAKELNAEVIYIKRSKEECLEVAERERPEEWKSYINSYFERLEEIEEEEKIKIIEVNTMEEVKKRNIIEIKEDEETITIVFDKNTDASIKTEDEEMDSTDSEEVDAESVETEEEIKEACGCEECDCGKVRDHIEGHEAEDEILEEIDEEEEEELEEDPENTYGTRSMEKINVWDEKHTSEKRFFNIETRIDKKEGRDVVVGHAAVFNTLSEDLGGFREKILPNAFDDVLNNDVRAYFNHDPNFLLGRTSAGTLRLAVDEKGLRYELDVPDTTAGRDLKENMRLGNITQSSFAFTLGQNGDSWERGEDGVDLRIIHKVNRLYDVSPVSLPAYPSANDLALAVRSNFLDKENQRNKEEKDFEMNTLLNLKINLLKRKK
jgi:HK97 family phage prohead protease